MKDRIGLVMADVPRLVPHSLSHNHHTVMCAVGVNDRYGLLFVDFITFALDAGRK